MPVRFLLAAVTGLSIGFVLPPLSTYTHFAHNGYSLYNVGFAAGVIATVVMSLCKSFGLTVESRLLWSTEYTTVFAVILAVLFVSMIVVSLFPSPKETLRGYVRIWKARTRRNGLSEERRRPSDHVQYGSQRPVCHGLRAGDWRSVKRSQHRSHLYGGGLQRHRKTSAGHCTGHVRESGRAITKQWNIYDPSAVLALLLSTTLAPISAKYWCILGNRCGLFTFFRCIECGHRVRWHEFIQ